VTPSRRFRRPLAAGLICAVTALAASTGAANAKPDAKEAVSTNTFIGNYLAGRQAQREGDLGAAAEFYGAALIQRPATPGLLRQTFIVNLIEGRVATAVALARDYLKEDPDQTIAQLTVAVDHMKHKRFKDAQALLSKLPDEGLSVFTKPLLIAWCQYGQGKAEDALNTLKPLEDKKGIENLVEIHEALILQLTGKTEDAGKLLTGVIERQSPPSSRVTHLLGALLERAGDTERAKAIYNLYLGEHPVSRLMDTAMTRMEAGKKPPLAIKNARDGAAEALYDIGSSLRRQNAHETAIALIQLSLYLKSDFPVARFILADILQSDERLEQAVKEYDGVDGASPYGWSAQLQAAALLGDLGRSDAAVKRLDKLAKLRPDLPDPHLHLGDVYRRMEDYPKAAKAYSAAIERVKTPQAHHWSLYYARGIAFERAKRWKDSEKDLLKALDLRPDQPYVLNYLGYTWIDQGEQLDRATDMIKKAVSLAPNDGFIADSLGWAYYRQNQFDKAVVELERAVELRPQDPVINDHLGDAYWKVGRKLEAQFQWKRSLSLAPDKDLIPKIQAKLDKGL
jgi:tetratricopeptide (TPR) repeat protein